MESLWHHYDVIFEKLVEPQASSAKIHIFIELMSEVILFLVDLSLIAHFFLSAPKKQNIWKIAVKWLKNGTLFVKKHYVDDVIKKGKHLFLNLTHSFICKVSVRLNKRWRSNIDFKMGSLWLSLQSFQQASSL